MKRAVRVLLVFCIAFNLIFIGLIGYSGYAYKKEKSNTVVVAAAQAVTKKADVINKNDFINIKEFIPDIVYEPRYKTTDNVTGTVLYSRDYPFLRYGTAVKLKKAQEEFSKMGIKIKIWDAYRPYEVQKKLWQKVSDSRFIANPARGSVHNRGGAVDMTLIDKQGKEVKMPSGFDEFDSKADRNYTDVDAQSASNAKVLENIMKASGFESVETEWWHFNDTEWKNYSIVEDVKDNVIKKSGYALEVSGSEIKEPDFEDEFNEFIAWMKDKIENVSIDSLKAAFKNQNGKMKGFIDNIINT